jgi:ADP-heptose:LPS heptosyltransferase
MDFSHAARLLELPFEFHSLQKELSEKDVISLASFPQLHRHENELHDFAETAALMEQMDLIISIDTSVANLAGALGKSVWVMLPYSSEFRWVAEGQKTPWYPTATLFRQKEIGNWGAVITEVEYQLRNFNRR